MEIKGELESGGLDFFFFLEIIFLITELENCKVEKSRIGISKCIPDLCNLKRENLREMEKLEIGKL